MDKTVITEDINSADPAQPVQPVGPITGPIQKVEEVKEVKEAVPVQAKEGAFSKLNPLKYINSPWILILIPALIGGVWLDLNQWVITDNLDKPYLMLVVPVAVASIVFGRIVLKSFNAILSACKSALSAAKRARQEDGSAQFFWLVIIVFMIVSVFASGTFFSVIEHNALPGLGYVTALFIDLVAVQAMRARLNAVRMRDKKGSSLYLFGVLLCAGASAFANVYTSLADFHQTLTGALPEWMLLVAPWFGLVFPALILLLSVTADYTIDQISTKLDPEQYKAQESKRTKLMEYQRDSLKERVILEAEIDRYTSQIQGKKERRVFFLIAWLFPVRQEKTSTFQSEEIKKEMTDLLDEQLKIFSQKTDFLYQQFGFLQNKVESLHQSFSPLFNDFSANFYQQYDADLDIINGHFSDIFSALDTQKSVFEEVRQDDEKNSTFSKLPDTGKLNKDPETDLKIEAKNLKVTRKLSAQDLSFDQKSEEKDEQKQRSPKTASLRTTTARMSKSKLLRNVYTSSEAARAAKCTVPDIEEALKSGDLSVSVNGKILKSSLEKFIIERREKSAQMLVDAK